MSVRVHLPWRGYHYESGQRGGLKLLVVGDSHYDGPADPFDPDLTIKMIVKGALCEHWSTYEIIRKIAVGQTEALQPSSFWQRMAFCNVVQDCMKSSSQAPRLDQFERGWEALKLTLAELRPDIMLMFSKRAWDADCDSSEIETGAARKSSHPFLEDSHLYQYERVDAPPLIAGAINHPSRLTRSVSEWRQDVERFWMRAQQVRMCA